MTVLSQGTESLKEDIVFDHKYRGRKLLVVHRHDIGAEPTASIPRPTFADWYSGYMQVMPTDKNYNLAKSGETWRHDFDHLYPHASGGITWAGRIIFDSTNYYVGFDTLHYFNNNWSVEDCIETLKNMVDIDQLRINRLKQLGE